MLLVLSPTVNTMGLVSRCSGDPKQHHVLFLDYDDCHESVVDGDVRYIQRYHGAGNAVVLRSGELDSNIHGEFYGNFHVICPAKFRFKEVCDIIANTHSDYNFREVAKRFNYRVFVIRIYPKYSEDGRMLKDRPHLHKVVYAKTSREVNGGIFHFLQKWYGVPDITGVYAPKLDGLEKVGIINYQTTLGWRIVLSQRIKSLGVKIKMHLKL
jgi:hypothetical protein